MASNLHMDRIVVTTAHPTLSPSCPCIPLPPIPSCCGVSRSIARDPLLWSVDACRAARWR
uniref:Uncharacterized protein n=1 Tax=Arundo donax TaxID=35708 RepID=A0A0A9D1L7_ARUDO